jgi:hypothetical protein
MLEFNAGKKLTDEELEKHKKKLIQLFAIDYDIITNRLWNCLRERPICVEFEEISDYDIRNREDLFFYLERQNELYVTTLNDVFRYVSELEPWEEIDGYITDESFEWLIAITHEDNKCLILGITKKDNT